MSIMKEQTWERHSNPLSVWTRVFTNPLVYVPVWNRSWRQAIPVAAWFFKPPLVPAPKRQLLVSNAQRPRRANMDQ
jgi:hypothetical protein